MSAVEARAAPIRIEINTDKRGEKPRLAIRCHEELGRVRFVRSIGLPHMAYRVWPMAYGEYRKSHTLFAIRYTVELFAISCCLFFAGWRLGLRLISMGELFGQEICQRFDTAKPLFFLAVYIFEAESPYSRLFAGCWALLPGAQ